MSSLKSSVESHGKSCTICNTARHILVRCQIDESGKWHFVCPGKCWNSVSGGEIDAKSCRDKHPYYRYGGMWKNRHADGPLTAKKPKKKEQTNKTNLNFVKLS